MRTSISIIIHLPKAGRGGWRLRFVRLISSLSSQVLLILLVSWVLRRLELDLECGGKEALFISTCTMLVQITRNSYRLFFRVRTSNTFQLLCKARRTISSKRTV